MKYIVTPKEKIEIFDPNTGGVRTFRPGDPAAYDKHWGLGGAGTCDDYFQPYGKIRSITPLAVTIVPYDFGYHYMNLRPRRVDFELFAKLNTVFDLQGCIDTLELWISRRRDAGEATLKIPTL